MKSELLFGSFIGVGILFSQTAMAQAPPLVAPQSTNNSALVCVDQNGAPIPDATWHAVPVTFVDTNGHFHGDGAVPGPPPLQSSTTPTSGTTDANGTLAFTTRTTLVGQIEAIDVDCSNANGTLVEGFEFGVGYGDLVMATSPAWIQTGGNTTGHSDNSFNHWMTPAAASGLQGAASMYLTAHPGQTQICTNDMALPIGGKFDLHDNWTSPHTSHDRGTAADIAGPGSGSCPAANQVNVAQFIAACVAHGAVQANSIPEGNHAHCNFASVNSYPH